MDKHWTHAFAPINRLGVSPTTVGAVAAAVVGLLLGVTVHKGFLLLFGLGAFGPPIARELGWLNDMDELQRAAAARAGLRAYLATGVFLLLLVVRGGWSTLDLSGDQTAASDTVTMLMVVYYASYCMTYWNRGTAVSITLATFGALWAVFVLLSHGQQPLTALAEGLAVPAPFFLAAWTCRKWPKITAAGLVIAAIAAVVVFRLPPWGDNSMLVFHLIPLPLLAGAAALLGDDGEAS